jgi:Rad3-related DNA helicase
MELKFSKIQEGYHPQQLTTDDTNNMNAKKYADEMAAIAADKAKIAAEKAKRKQQAIDAQTIADENANDAYGILLGKKAVFDKAAMDASNNKIEYGRIMSGATLTASATESSLLGILNEKNKLVTKKSETVEQARGEIGQTYSVYDTDIKQQGAALNKLNNSTATVNTLNQWGCTIL